MQKISKNNIDLIILDRDGVINYDSDNYIKNIDEWIPINGSLEAISKLTKKGIKVAIATNQSGIARKYYDFHTLHSMHNKMINILDILGGKISYISICPHMPNDNCHCRKPNIGMLKEISQKLKIPLNKKVYFIGDSKKDIEASLNANVTPILVKTGKGTKTLEKIINNDDKSFLNKFNVFNNLNDFVTMID